MKTRIFFTTLLLISITTSLAIAQTATAPAAGDGSSGSPYEIATLNNLYWLSQNDSEWDKHYIQTTDIDASDTESWDSGAGLSPIGTNNMEFTGTYNGDGHTITGLTINRKGSNFIGLFGAILGAVIENLGLINADITGGNLTGGIAGRISTSTVNLVFCSGNVSGGSRTGGLIGRLASGTVSNSFNTANVFARIVYATGGIAGQNSDGNITNSYNTGNISGQLDVGGIAGSNDSPITKTYNSGKITGSRSGGIVGIHSNDINVEDSYWNVETSGTSTSDGGTGLTTVEMRQQNSFDGFNFNNTWNINENQSYPYLQNNIQPGLPPGHSPFEAGDGSSNHPYQVANLTMLDSVRNYLDKNFIQTADIDASDTQNWESFSWTGLIPIGNDTFPFTGVYDGNNHKISGLHIDPKSFETEVGLFGKASFATIKNIGLENIDISGGYKVGGLVGWNDHSTISNSYSTGSVYGQQYIGGIAGTNEGTITKSYSTAKAEGNFAINDEVGGLVGNNFEGTITTSYATGSVSGNPQTGGLVAIEDNATVTDSYWNTGTSGQTTSAGGTGLNSAQMQQETSFNGFDFTSTWSIDEGNSYPYLQANPQSSLPGSEFTTPSTGDGSEGSPFEIASLGNLKWLIQNIGEWDKYFIQTTDIDASDTGNWDDGAGFNPIGNATIKFTGSYDGDGHIISGLIINRGSSNEIGFFGYTDGATIENLGMVDVDITGNNRTAALVGRSTNSTTVRNTYSTGNISGNNLNTGGIVGYNDATITNSYSAATVSGHDNTGGLIGDNWEDGAISTSYSTGPVSGSTDNGGLIGTDNGGSVTDSYWNIETSGQSTSGGGTGLTTTEMKQQVTFGEFDFTDTWSIDEGNSYPYLQNIIPSPLPGISDESTVLYNQSLSFNGTDNYVEIPDHASLDLTNGFTIEAWVKPETIGTDIQRIVAKKNAYGFGFTNSFLRFTAYGRRDYDLSYSLETNQWVHLACVLDANNDAHFYVDGALVGTISGSSPANVDTDPLVLGSTPGTEHLNGQLDNVRLWSDVRTPGEIRRNMFQSLNGDEKGLAGYWPLKEGDGDLTFDFSSNSNHGSLQNGPTWSTDTHPYGTVITSSEGWRLMSSPMDGISYSTLLDSLWTQGFTGSDSPDVGDPNVFTWDEASGNWTPLTNAANVPGAGTGFLVYVYDDQDYDGTPEGFPKTIRVDNTQNDGSVAPVLSYTDAGVPEGDGWNLVGNPYGTTLNWNAPSGWSRTNLDASFYVWNAAAGAYQSHNGESGTLPDSLIGPWQGFWVKANATNPELTITDTVRSAGGVLLKENPVPQITLTLKKEQDTSVGRLGLPSGGSEKGAGASARSQNQRPDGLSSNAVVMFNSEAAPDKDFFDAWKLQSLNQKYLSLYTTDTERHALDINALPMELESPLEINLGFKGSDLGGEYTLSWNPQDLPDTWAEGSIRLIDLHTDRILSLNQAGEYSFEVAKNKSSKDSESLEGSKQSETRLIASPQHDPIPTVLKAKAANPRFVLTVNPKAAGNPMGKIPETTELAQNYPNPFNPETVIRYGVPEQAEVQLNVYDVLGRKVRTLINEQKSPGRYEVNFNASELASGLYFYRLKVGAEVLTKKMMLIK